MLTPVAAAWADEGSEKGDVDFSCPQCPLQVVINLYVSQAVLFTISRYPWLSSSQVTVLLFVTQSYHLFLITNLRRYVLYFHIL